MTDFEGFPSIKRLFREMVITEKLDGTNAAVVIDDDGKLVACQSRKRIITPGDDNYGFAAWAYGKAEQLAEILGPGRHFGEWWGQGIQRKYGLTEKRFSLFNAGRWTGVFGHEQAAGWPQGLSVVPVLYTGSFDTYVVEKVKLILGSSGSVAAPGFMDPEGVVVWHDAARVLFKSTFDAFDTDGGKTWSNNG